MIVLNGNPFPENQKEYCFLCIDRLEECCPCDSYNKLPDDEKFDLEDIDLTLGDSYASKPE